MSTATATATASRAAAQISAKGSKVLLRHDARVVDAETGALSGASSPTDYQIRGIFTALSLAAGPHVQQGDVQIMVSANDVPSRPTPNGWTAYVGGGIGAAWPVPGGVGVEKFTVVDGQDPVQESDVSFIYYLQCRR